MYLKYSVHFERKAKKEFRKKPQLKKKVAKQLKRLLDTPSHLSLKLHKLTGNRKGEIAIWIEGDLRITFVKKRNYYLLTDMITHDEY